MQRTLLYPSLAIATLLAGACGGKVASPTSPSPTVRASDLAGAQVSSTSGAEVNGTARHGAPPPPPPHGSAPPPPPGGSAPPQPSLGSAPPPASLGEIVSGTGTIVSYGTGRKGETDKFFLRDSAGAVWEVRFPPHEASRVQTVAPTGDANIKVDGIKHTGPKGDTHIRATTIADLDDGQSITFVPPSHGSAPPPPPHGSAPPPPPFGGAPPPPSHGETVSSSGTVVSYGTGRKGETDKFFLRDSAGVVWEVRFPPHEASRVQAIAPAGDANIKVTGIKHTGPRGDTHIRATSITDLDDGQSIP